ncbi:hypothetical protein O0L34_g18661 [Tuta absoluta]|nr:hypothetical protein O0L34_g18661 [Tuta absoluta]
MEITEIEVIIKQCQDTITSINEDNVVSVLLLQKLSSKLNEQQRTIKVLSDKIKKLQAPIKRNEPQIPRPQRKAAINARANLSSAPRKYVSAVIKRTNSSKETTSLQDGDKNKTSTPRTPQFDHIASTFNDDDSKLNNDLTKDLTNCEQEDNEGQWINVNRRKGPKSKQLVKGAATNTPFGGFDVPRYVHGCFFSTSSTPENINNHLKSVHSADYTVEEIASKRDTYKSFKIGIPSSAYNKIMDPSVWPTHVTLSQWRPFLADRKNRTQPTHRANGSRQGSPSGRM